MTAAIEELVIKIATDQMTWLTLSILVVRAQIIVPFWPKSADKDRCMVLLGKKTICRFMSFGRRRHFVYPGGLASGCAQGRVYTRLWLCYCPPVSPPPGFPSNYGMLLTACVGVTVDEAHIIVYFICDVNLRPGHIYMTCMC